MRVTELLGSPGYIAVREHFENRVNAEMHSDSFNRDWLRGVEEVFTFIESSQGRATTMKQRMDDVTQEYGD